MSRSTLLDKSWVCRAFLVPESSLTDSIDNERRYYSTASRKFTDTTFGGNLAINPLSQFTSNCDFNHKSVFSSSEGVGRYWSEVIEDDAQYVHISAGVPEFNSMTNFFGNFYNVYAGAVARTGRGPDAWYYVGRAAGFVASMPLQPFIMAGSVIKFMFGMPRSKFYYHKRTMYPYWYAVSSMVNGIMASMGMIARFSTTDQKRFYDPVMVPGQSDLSAQNRVFSGFTNSEGGLDVFALSTRAQRLASRYRTMLDNELSKISGNPDSRYDELRSILLEGALSGTISLSDKPYSLDEFEKNYLSNSGQWDDIYEQNSEKVDLSDQSLLDKLASEFSAQRMMGADFVTFRVNHTGSQSESFSNSSVKPTIEQEINSISSKNRMARFNIADGNISEPIGWIANKVKSFAAGIAEEFQLEGFIALAGNAFADIQKTYESSSADLNRATYTIPLRCWAADDWLRVKNLFLPLCALLALGLPRATGRSSYDGPFLLEVYDKGRLLIREGMVESISVTRGVGNVGWTKDKKVLGIDVTMTIVDMSTILSMPINPGFSPVQGVFTGAAELAGAGVDTVVNATTGVNTNAQSAGVSIATALTRSTYGEDNKYTDYLTTLASLPYEDLISPGRMWALNMAKGRAEYAQWKSPARVMSSAFDTMPGDIIKAISLALDPDGRL